MLVKLAPLPLLSKALKMHLVKEMKFSHIDKFNPRLTQGKLKSTPLENKATVTEPNAWNPERLENGKWACNHRCKDKTV